MSVWKIETSSIWTDEQPLMDMADRDNASFKEAVIDCCRGWSLPVHWTEFVPRHVTTLRINHVSHGPIDLRRINKDLPNLKHLSINSGDIDFVYYYMQDLVSKESYELTNRDVIIYKMSKADPEDQEYLAEMLKCSSGEVNKEDLQPFIKPSDVSDEAWFPHLESLEITEIIGWDCFIPDWKEALKTWRLWNWIGLDHRINDFVLSQLSVKILLKPGTRIGS